MKKVAGSIDNRFGRELKSSSDHKKSQHRWKLDEQRKINANAIQNGLNEERSITRTSRKCPQCLGPHGIWRCPTFKGLALKDHLKVVKQHKLCRICLDKGHFARSSKSGFMCRKEGLRKDHHFLNHTDQNDEKNDSNAKSQEGKTQRGARRKMLQPRIVLSRRGAALLQRQLKRTMNPSTSV